MRPLLVLLLILSLWGCQGVQTVRPSASEPLTPSSAETASLSIRISLPRETQAIPSNAQSIQVLLRKTGMTDRTATVNTGSATSVTFSSLPPGSGYTLYGASYAGLNGTGSMLSWGTLPLTLASGLNSASFGLSVAVRSGSGADNLITGPAGNQAQQFGAQRIFTSLNDFNGPRSAASGVEVFYPGQYGYLGQVGTRGTGNGQFWLPEGIGIDSQGNLYVVDRFNHRVQKFDRNGTFLRGWGQGQVWTGAPPATASGTANSWFNEPVGLAVDPAGNVWVADRLNARLQKFDPNGTFLMGVGSGQVWFGTAPAPAVSAASTNGYFSANLHGLVADPSGNVFVADVNNYRVVKVNSSGQVILSIGNGTKWSPPAAAPVPATTNGNGYFGGGHAVELDPYGNLYVAETINNRIQKFDPNGSYLGQFPHTNTYGTTVTLTGGLVSVSPFDTATCGIDVMAPDGTVLSRFGVGGTGNGQFANIRLMRFAPDGVLWVSDGENNRLQRFRGLTPQNLADPQGGLRLTGHRQPDTPVFTGSGTYETPLVDAGASTTWGSIFWNVSVQPASTGVSTAVATSSNGLTFGSWVTVSGSSALGNNSANLSGITGRYLKIRVSLISTNPAVSPEVQEVGVTY